jgi:hypothetical protein
VRKVSKKADLERLGFGRKQCNVSALLIPIFGPTGEIVLYQARPDEPRIGKNGKPIKYETPAGAHMALDAHPRAQPKLKDPDIPLFVTEGIKKGDSLVSRGLIAIALIGVWNFRGTNEHGGKTALADWEYIALNGRQVYDVFDSDVMLKLEVHKTLVRLKAFLEHRGAHVALIDLPSGDGAVKQGVDDYLAAGHSIDELLALATTELRAPPKDETKASDQAETGRREIIVNNRFRREITDDSLEVLEAQKDMLQLYMRGDVLARVEESTAKPLTQVGLSGILDRAADYVKAVSKQPEGGGEPEVEYIPARPPQDVMSDILSLPSLPFYQLESIAQAPVFVPPGKLLRRDGYDPESGILLRLQGLDEVRADMPISEARDLLLNELLIDFPFVEAAGWAHTLALILQPFVRSLVKGATPLYLIDAPARGTGKGLLADVFALIPTGALAEVMVLTRDSDETEKRITAALLAGLSHVLFDNVTDLRAAVLAAVLTAELWRGRLLGASKMVHVSNTATWLATGNNITLSDELVRRVIPIRLDAGVERPEERTAFRRPNLTEWVRQHRTELVSACLSLVQAWIAAGMPNGIV